jgi:hypothetical protein
MVFASLLLSVFPQHLTPISHIPFYYLAIIICVERSFWLMSATPNAVSFENAFPKALEIWNGTPQKHEALLLEHWSIPTDRESPEYEEFRQSLLQFLLENRLRMFLSMSQNDNTLIINSSPSSTTVNQ